MVNSKEILQTLEMIDQQHLDIRTITMGISLRDCAHPDADKCCDKIYDKITRCAEKLVKTGEDIEREFGIPIVNKRISVTPMAAARQRTLSPLQRQWTALPKRSVLTSSAAFPPLCTRALQAVTAALLRLFLRHLRRQSASAPA